MVAEIRAQAGQVGKAMSAIVEARLAGQSIEGFPVQTV
jgi:hypothetical protein